MIFIGAELSDSHAHFVTNIVACIGSGDDLIIDLLKVKNSEKIFNLIEAHLQDHDEKYVVYNAYTDENFFIGFRDRFPKLKIITVFSDDEWRHANYDRYLALYSDVFTIAVKDNLGLYRGYGLEPFYMQWACNPGMFHPLPDQDKDIDVSFIGAAYGQRVAYIQFLIANGIKVKVFGRGWDRHADTRPHWGGYLSHKAMLEVIARSRINLNFLWTSAEKERCTIKGRTLELSACRAFQLSNPTDEFANYAFIDGENIAVFQNKDDLLDKIEYYLVHGDEREAIASMAYDHVLKHHTWKQRFQAVFVRLEKPSMVIPKARHKYRIMVLARNEVHHQINLDDERMDIRIGEPDDNWRDGMDGIDGVVQLAHDSSINNETLYMMAFGLMADQSDAIAANFYVDAGREKCWIRFRDKLLEKRRLLLRMLPQECIMFSNGYAQMHGAALVGDIGGLRVSYIEYPSFSICLPYCSARKLTLYFGHHRDARNRFRKNMRDLHIGRAFSLGVDVVWQRMLGKRTGA